MAAENNKFKETIATLSSENQKFKEEIIANEEKLESVYRDRCREVTKVMLPWPIRFRWPRVVP